MKRIIKTFIYILGLFLLLNSSIVYASGNQALLVGNQYTDGLDTRIDATSAGSRLAPTKKTLITVTAPTISYIKGTHTNTKRMESDILFFSGHGNNTLMHFYNTSSDFYITAGSNSSNTVGLSSYTMSNVKLVVFAGCQTANNSSSNLAKSANSLGAKATLGWIPSIQVGSHSLWLDRFWLKAATETHAQTALTYADSFSYTDNGVKSYRKYGTWNYTAGFKSSGTSIYNSPLINKDKREHIVNISLNNNDLDRQIENAIIENIDSGFNINMYSIYKTIRDDATIIDITLQNNDIKSTIGYVVFVENNKITKIYDNTNNMKMSKVYESMNTQIGSYQTNQSKTNKNLFANAIKDIDTSLLEIVDQKIEKFYDENNNKIYYNVSTTVKTQTGEISIFVYQEYIN